jgi:hypothetical protein
MKKKKTKYFTFIEQVLFNQGNLKKEKNVKNLVINLFKNIRIKYIVFETKMTD